MRLRALLGPLVALGAVAVTTAVLRAAHADLTVAALVYLIVIVLTALGGYWAVAVASVLAYLSLNYWFIPRYGAFTFETVDDVAPLVTFALAAVAAGVTVARINVLRRRAEEHEQAAFDARVAAAVNESRAAFLSAMTHNLRTPLAAIKASIATLQHPDARIDDATRARLLETAHEETERLERLVDKVLELSRIHAGALEPDREPTDVGELVRGAVRRLRALAPRERVRLAAVPDVVVADVDPGMVELVIVVLLENALRYGGDDTEVVVDVAALPDGACRIRVVDHGPGIAPEHRAKVFEEFTRLGAAPDSSGSGLGLAIARAIVDAHHGTITIEDTPGGGATFVVHLPGSTAR